MSKNKRGYELTVFGPGEPHLTLIVGVHGDELVPVRAAAALLNNLPASRLLRAVQLVVANPRACSARTRYIETDLNRSFSGEGDGNSHEQRLAREIVSTLPETPFMVDLHSTDFPVPAYGVIAHTAVQEPPTIPALTPIQDYIAVDFPCLISAYPGAQAFEVGHDRDPRTEVFARDLIRTLLTQSGCLDGPSPPPPTVRVHRVTDLIRKKDFATLADLRDFQLIRAGELLGIGSDGTERCATRDCVPVWVNHPTAIRLAESVSIPTGTPSERRRSESTPSGEPS